MLAEILDWLHTDLRMTDPQALPIKKLYVSDMFVTLDKPLNFINPKLQKFLKLLAGKTKSPIEHVKYDLGSLGFWIDPVDKPPHTPFRLERAEGVPFAENRYYSIAPLETEEHLRALTILEEMLAA